MYINQIILGDSVVTLHAIPAGSVDLMVTDPPYLVNYRDRSGRCSQNDDNPSGVLPVFEPMSRTMKANSYAIWFAGWSALPQFSQSWEAAGLRIVGQFVWAKDYASRKGFAEYRHETAYLLAKGRPAKPSRPLPSVLKWVYSGNRAYPTEKALDILTLLIRCFSKPGDLVCDPFSGSGSTSVASALTGRRYLGIDIDAEHVATARTRLAGVEAYLSGKSGRAAA